MVYPVKELFQVHIDNPFVPLCYVSLRLGHRLMSTTMRTKTIAVNRKGRVEYGIENLQDRLLDKSIQYRRYAEPSDPAAGFGNQNLLDRLRAVISSQQPFPNRLPVLPQIARQVVNGHAVYAWAAFVRTDPFQRPDQVLSVDNLIHQINHHGFGSLRCRCRLMRLAVIPAGFTRQA